MNTMLTVRDFEAYAGQYLPKKVRDYYQSGANDQFTLAENKSAFSRLRIRPRFLCVKGPCSLSTSLLNQSLNTPIGVAPSAMQKMAHPDGEIATAKACEQTGSVFILSTISTTSIEDVAAAAPNAIKWFQLYVHKDRTLTESLVRRAEAANFKALVLTIDTPALGSRLADRVNQFELDSHLTLANLDRTLNQQVDELSLNANESALQAYAKKQFDPNLSWECVDWLRSITKLPIVLKGILTEEDACLAVSHSVDAIIVSNHGARQLDYVPATIDALPEVVQGAGGRCEVYLDGGIQTGTDVFKALAIGAKAVFVGRAALWGLSHSGQQGVTKVLDILNEELKDALLLSGAGTVENLNKSFVRTIDEYRQFMTRFLK